LALSQERIRVHYQPIVDLTTGEVVAVEALLRIEDEAGNLELPGEYVAVAEENGLIGEIGRRVLDRACAALAAWRLEWGERAPLRVAVNISGRQLGSPDFVDQVTSTLAAHGLSPSDLSLEFTESTVLTADRETLRTAERLRALGVLLSVDDFGTGYSSLAYLKRFPIGAVKLERVFVAGLGDDPSDAEIIRAVVSLGDALGLDVVAEGIETATQLQMLQHLGCSYGQGFLLSHPMAADDLDLDAVAGIIGATAAGWAVSGA
jgi:EAL domain-containing protein (putative c-di-GMP-specific phosphodiesterase class I)